MSKQYKTNAKKEHKIFLMSFFQNEEGYEEKKVNNHWLIKQWDGNLNKWTIHLYSEDSYNNYKRAHSLFKENSTKLPF